MERHVIFGTVFAAALTVGVAAQTPPTGSQDPTRTGQSNRNAQTITVTGCLQNASGAAGTSGAATGTGTGTSGTSASRPSSSDEFVLTNASMGSGSSSTGAAGTGTGTGTGTSGTGTSSAASGTTYKLTGGDKEDLQKNLNSKVEIRGRLDNSKASGAGTSAGTGTGTGTGTGAGTSAGTGTSSMSGMEGQRLHVESVRQISPSCSGQ